MPQRPTVILLHGLFGFRRFLWFDYFRGVKPLLESLGCRVIVTGVSWSGPIEMRAEQLARQLATEPGPLHLIAHSMGGLDARRFITHLGGAGKVASLTTLATPHHGSPAADDVCHGFSLFRLSKGVHDLTTESMHAFNASTPDHPDVIYRSYSASRPLNELPWLTRHYARAIMAAEGENDSQVSVRSARWGEHIETLPADHFELIGLNLWLNRLRKRKSFNHLDVYRDIAEWIRSQGARSPQ